MAYLIYKSDGTSVSIPDNAVDLAFYNGAGGGGFGPGNVPQSGHGLGIGLVGRNTIDYGAPIAQNFLQITENFCSSSVPADATALQGQLWFNQTSTTTGKLYVRVSGALSGGLANWEQLVTVNSAGNSTITGDLNVSGSITAEGGNHVPVVFTATPGAGVAQTGDIRVLTSPTLTISIYGNGTWNQVFPAIYS